LHFFIFLYTLNCLKYSCFQSLLSINYTNGIAIVVGAKANKVEFSKQGK